MPENSLYQSLIANKESILSKFVVIFGLGIIVSKLLYLTLQSLFDRFKSPNSKNDIDDDYFNRMVEREKRALGGVQRILERKIPSQKQNNKSAKSGLNPSKETNKAPSFKNKEVQNLFFDLSFGSGDSFEKFRNDLFQLFPIEKKDNVPFQIIDLLKSKLKTILLHPYFIELEKEQISNPRQNLLYALSWLLISSLLEKFKNQSMTREQKEEMNLFFHPLGQKLQLTQIEFFLTLKLSFALIHYKDKKNLIAEFFKNALDSFYENPSLNQALSFEGTLLSYPHLEIILHKPFSETLKRDSEFLKKFLQQLQGKEFEPKLKKWKREEIDESFSLFRLNLLDDLSIAKKRYKKLILKYHPDRAFAKASPQELEQLNSKIQKINVAFEKIETICTLHQKLLKIILPSIS